MLVLTPAWDSNAARANKIGDSMLAAVLNGKRRGSGVAGKQLILGSTQGAEDVLTATIFERLAYLPESVLATFFSYLLQVDEPIGTLGFIEFWPSWSLDGKRIEPDVVLYGSERTLLIEAKRYDDSNQQYAVQLANELKAGWECGRLGNAPLLLTIGGLQDYSQETAAVLRAQINGELDKTSPDYELICRSWYQVYQALELAIVDADKDASPGLQRLLDDIASTFEWHGLRTQARRWLGQLKPVSIQLTPLPFYDFKPIASTPCLKQPELSYPLSHLPVPCIAFVAFPIKEWSLTS